MPSLVYTGCHHRRRGIVAHLLYLLSMVSACVFAVDLNARPVALDTAETHIAFSQSQRWVLDANEVGDDPMAALAALRQGEFSPANAMPQWRRFESDWWLAVEVDVGQRTDKEPWFLVLEPPTINTARLYHFKDDQLLSEQQSGDLLPLSERALQHRTAAFNVGALSGTHLLLLRITFTGAVDPEVWLKNQSAFEATVIRESLFFGAYFGVCLIAFLISFAGSGLEARAEGFLFSGFIFSLSTYWFFFDGLAGLLILPESPVLANQLFNASLSISVLFSNFFFWRLFSVVRFPGWSSRLLMVCNAALFIVTGLTFLPGVYSTNQWSLLAILVSTFAILPHMVRAWGSRDIYRKAFSYGLLPYLLILMFTPVVPNGWLPERLWVIYAPQVTLLVLIGALMVGFYGDYRRRAAEQQEVKLDLVRRDVQATQITLARGEQEQMIRMLSHEVLTPAAVVQAVVDSLELGEQREQGVSFRQERYDKLKSAVDRVRGLVGQLQASLGSHDAHPEWRGSQVDITRVLHDSLALLGLDEYITAICSDHVNLPDVVGDDASIAAVVRELLDNAIKYTTNADSVVAAIRPETVDSQRGVTVEITNEVADLPEGFEHAIFQKYVRVGDHQCTPGLGMGLAMARALIQNFGGRLTARGTLSTITLSLWLPSSEEA